MQISLQVLYLKEIQIKLTAVLEPSLGSHHLHQIIILIKNNKSIIFFKNKYYIIHPFEILSNSSALPPRYSHSLTFKNDFCCIDSGGQFI